MMLQPASCALCELPCAGQRILRRFGASDLVFCCMGCANVYAILEESGAIASGQCIRESEIFKRSLELGLISNAGQEPAAAAGIGADAETKEQMLEIGGMWCSACGWLIEHALKKLTGVISAEVFFASDLAKVKYCPQYLPPGAISARIAQLGYRASEYEGGEAGDKPDLDHLMLRSGVAAFLWANIMAFSVILYVGYFEPIAQSVNRSLPYILLALTTPIVFYCAWPILRSAAIGLRNLQIRMELLLALGILTAYLLSTVQTLRGQTHVYFDTSAAIVTLVLIGKLIERSAKAKAARSISTMYRLMPKKVRVMVGGGERFVSVDALEPGAHFLVKVGERIPADGIVLEGESETDESLLTGETAPVPKGPGDKVVSGSLNTDGTLLVRATRRGDQSALAQIVRLVERALATRAPIERTVDTIARAFVPAVIVLALGDFAVLTMMHVGIGVALMRATSILVIACPCALGLAMPLAITAALSAASESGILISDSHVLQTIGKIDVVVLDKTGTMTCGDFRLLEIASASGVRGDARDLLREDIPVLAGMEILSEHLLGRAVVQYAGDHQVRPVEVDNVVIRKGQGMTASHADHCYFIGNRKLAQSFAKSAAETDALAEEWQRNGTTVAYFGRDGELRGLMAFGDRIKPGAEDLVNGLRRRGIHTMLVSGDARCTTSAVAARIGVDDFAAEVAPEGKSSLVQKLQRAGKRVAVIGDGVNDAPALATADLGIALGTGADIAMSAAPVVLVSGSLEKVEDIFQLAAKASRVIRQNLFWAFFYNTAGIALAMSGRLNPIMAAGAMLLSSTSVVANSMRLSQVRHSIPARAATGVPVCEDRMDYRNQHG